MTDNARKAGSENVSEPAREQVVIRDKRKIDASGRSAAGAAEAAATSKENEARDSEARANEGAAVPGETAQSTAQEESTQDSVVRDGAAPEVAAEPVVEGADGGSDAAPDGAAGEEGKPAAEAGGVTTVPHVHAELEALRKELDERTRDLQRVGAEYANYRKRVERDRAAVIEQAIGNVIGSLLPVLDDIDRAREHGDLVGPFAAVADQLIGALSKYGLTGFGEVGDPFDPTKHEAVTHERSSEVTQSTCVSVMRRGYLLGDRLLRAAMVGVADPE
ncbi:MAG TPA: nucleotide exchange factor GrpE [Micromonosporaceae bacterium]|nr:nucleotide exchange factor GrpE [Micromonosporaceae bacterium]